jgi:multiple sugar transport system substrate-binding protein
MQRVIRFAAGIALLLGISTAAHAQQKLVVWWTKGDTAEADKGIQQAVAKFKQQTGTDVELSFFSSNDMVTKSNTAVATGSPPDVAFGTIFDMTVTPRWAFQGKLTDLSDVVLPMKDKFYPSAIDGVTFLNGDTGKRSIYGVPVGQTLRAFHYWRDLVQEAGFEEKDIPQGWKEFFDFWCDKVQAGLRAKRKRVYGIGQGLSGTAGASDIFHHFFMTLEAHNVRWISEDGTLNVDDPKVRQGFINAVTDMTGLLKRGCTPDTVVTWTNEDNNTYFNNRSTVATSAASLSIPQKHIDDGAKENYYEKIRTIGFPNGLDGKPVANVSQTRAMVVFKDAQNVEGAKKFVQFLSQPEIMGPYVEASNGAIYPSLAVLGETPFWNDPKDPHRYATHMNFQNAAKAGRIARFPNHYNWKLSAANAENIWGRSMGRVVAENWPVEKAVDEMLARVKDLAK